MGDLEAQAREFVTKSWPYKGTTDVKVRAALAWARRLVADSRAGALREAKRYMKHDGPCVMDATLALIRQQELVCECGRDALAAEAEPGAQDRAGKGEK